MVGEAPASDISSMTKHQLTGLRAMEGRRVSVALVNGSRLDDCTLVSAGRAGARTAWIYSNGMDVFLPLSYVADVWESR
jgi:hypothetical protein